MQNLIMYNLLLTAIIGSVLIAGVAFSPLLSGQFHLAYAQDNATTMSGNMTGNATAMTGNGTGASSGNSVTISPGSSVPSNGKFFVPETLTVSKGTTVTWTNGDSTLHTVTSGSPEAGNSGSEFDSSYLAAGKTFQHPFNTAGTFDYYCTLHPFMKGKVVVS
ncbi:MAG TPA: cupredoxin family copper-binding protein [Nitrososphaeraceae archaeon]|nr:cupredoxin family copper-binding protein [Nitrososphaeraceae archaeon]